ncbi:NAD-dependent epimerase/dehydratase family protein [Ruegeria lacuscaerulensis]|uniref:NAD-dependent epimerase/dehydratase family protein n=1 Tax=Ruegeria lacuscaerulensis TaxID=55218 RepID=UPI002F26C7E9
MARCALTLTGKNILVLGAYGFIGAAVVRALRGRGAQVTGLVRKPVQGALLLDGIKLVQGDLRRFTHPQDWEAALTGIDCVVNCAGALQDGPSDDLAVVHHHAIAALGQACAKRGVSVVQI